MFFIKTNTTKLGFLLLTAFGSLNAQEFPSPSIDNGYQPNCCTSWMDNFSIKAEGLYWNVQEDNINYIRENTISTVTNVVNNRLTIVDVVQDGDTKQLGSNWTGGYRIGLDYTIPCTCWDLDLIYTHLHNKKCATKSAPNDTVRTVVGTVTTVTLTSLVALFPGTTGLTSAAHVDATWNLDFNSLDLLLGRDFTCWNCVNLHPFFGLRYLDIRQRLRIAVRAVDDLTLTSDTFGAVRNTTKTGYWGVGFQGGVDFDWKLGCGFAIYSQAAGGLVYGREHSDSKRLVDSLQRTNVGVNVNRTFRDLNFDISQHHDVAKANVDFALGIEWECFVNNCSKLTFNLGWEYHYFFDQNFFRSVESFDTSGDLCFQGVTFGVDYQF